MAMNIYSDTPTSGPISFAIHWDNTKFLDDGAGNQIPDPAYVKWYTFPGIDRAAIDVSGKPANRTAAQYRDQVQATYAAQCQGEARLLAKEVRKARNRAARKATDLGAPTVDNS